jgi:ArsR family transcriptional regulator
VVVDAVRHADEELRRRMGQVHPGFEPDDLTARLRAAGFEAAAVRTLPPEPGASGPGLVVCATQKNDLAGGAG